MTELWLDQGPNPNVGLVCSGGALKGARQAGALSCLADRGIFPGVMAGTSTGSLTAAMGAQAETLREFQEQAQTLAAVYISLRKEADLHRVGSVLPGLLGKAWALWRTWGIWNPEKGLEKLLRRHVSPLRLATSPVRLLVSRVDLNSGRHESVEGDNPEIVEAVLASASEPLVWPPVKGKQGERWVDGGVREITPLRAAIHALREKALPGITPTLWILLARPFGMTPVVVGSALDVAARAVSILTDEVFLGDLRSAVRVNAAPKEGQRAMRFVVVAPPPGSISPKLIPSPEEIEIMMREGREGARFPLTLESEADLDAWLAEYAG